MDHYDDWAIAECDYCHEQERKCYRQDDLPLNEQGEPQYYCAGEDCKNLRYFDSQGEKL